MGPYVPASDGKGEHQVLACWVSLQGYERVWLMSRSATTAERRVDAHDPLPT